MNDRHPSDRNVNARPVSMADVEGPVLAPLLLKPEEAADVLRVSRNKVYELMRTERLRSVRIGGLRRISVSALTDFVDSLDTGEPFAVSSRGFYREAA